MKGTCCKMTNGDSTWHSGTVIDALYCCDMLDCIGGRVEG